MRLTPQIECSHISIMLIVSVLMLVIVSCSDSIDKSKLDDFDYRLYIGTSAEKLAIAVSQSDTLEIRKQVLNEGIDVDTPTMYGTTLLMMATCKNNLTSVRCLLNLGANPNLHSNENNSCGENAVLIASRRQTPSVDMLKLLLSYGGNPNSQARGVQFDNLRNLVPMRDFALQVASRYSFEKVKALIESGADVNMMKEKPKATAIYAALTNHNMKILFYLLNAGADYNLSFENGDYSVPETTCYEVDILYKLRQVVLPLDSIEYQYKLKVIKFLKDKDLDYRNSEIPEYIIKKIKKSYPNSWKEYLEKY